MTRHATDLARMLDSGIVAVVRLDSADRLVELARALVRGGVEAVEITLTVPGALQAIAAASTELGDDALIGAGTVLHLEDARRSLEAGARFVVAPTVDPDVVRTTRDAGAVAVPGALTPTEIDLAMRSGADLVKLFPGRVATPGYFRDVLGPFPTARLLPTGNVDLTTAPEYFRAGAVAVGVGKALVDPDAVRTGDWDTIERLAREFRRTIDDVRGDR